MAKTRVSVLAAIAIVMAPGLVAGSVFKVTVQQAGEETAAGLGVLIAEEFLLTSESLVGQGDQSLVNDSASGATIVAEVRARFPEADLALLHVPSLTGEAPAVALEASGAGRHVYLLVLDDVRREGVFHSVLEVDGTRVLYRYTSIRERNEAGAPLMNNCDELLAVSQPAKDTEPDAQESSFGVSGSLPDVVEFLKANEVDFQTAPEACPSLRDQLSKASDSSNQLAEEKAALEQEIKELEESLDQGQRQSQEQIDEVESRRAELESLLQRKNAELAAKEAEVEERARLQAELEERNTAHQEELRRRDEEFAEFERQQQEASRLRWYLGGGLGTVLLLLCAVAWKRSKARQAELRRASAELEAARSSMEATNATFADVVLVGDGPASQEVRVKVNGNALARAETGQVVGRSSANADYVIAEGSVSRRHALLRVSAGEMTIEDLSSLNGTTVDGVKLQAGEIRTVAEGTRIALGDVELVARFLRG